MKRRILAIGSICFCAIAFTQTTGLREPGRIGLGVSPQRNAKGFTVQKDPIRIELREIRTTDSTNVYNVGALIQYNVFKDKIQAARDSNARDAVLARMPTRERPLPDWDVIHGNAVSVVKIAKSDRCMVGITNLAGERLIVMNFPGSCSITNGSAVSCYAFKRVDLDGAWVWDYGIPLTNKVASVPDRPH